MPEYWTEELFLKHGHLYRQVLEGLLPRAAEQAEGIREILLSHGIGKGKAVLDLACGIGRHSVELARQGYRVTGLDISPDFIQRAEQVARERHVEEDATFRLGDMRDLEGLFAGKQFDAVVNVFTSFGYYDEETNAEILSQCRQFTRKGGIFLIDTVCRDGLARSFRSQTFTRVEDLLLLQECRIHQETGRAQWQWTFLREQEKGLLKSEAIIDVDLQVFNLHELIGLFARAGWSFVTAYADFQGTPLEFGSRRLVALFANKTRENGAQ